MKEFIRSRRPAYWLQLLFVFFLPLWQQVSVISLILLLVLTLLSGKIRESLRIYRQHKMLWIFSGLYLVHIAGIFYSQNLSYGFFDLQVKLSFLLIPLFLSAVLPTGKEFRQIKKSFIFGNITASLLCLALAIAAYYSDARVSHFFYIDYSHFLHTTYFSMYLNLAVLFLLDSWFQKSDDSWKNNKWIPALVLFLLINIIMLFSRTAMVIAFFSIGVFLLIKRKVWFEEKRKAYLILAGTLILVCAQIVALHFNNRFVQVEQVMEHSSGTWNESKQLNDTLNHTEDNSTSTRLRLWKNALELISRHPYAGVGTGDIKDELKQQYALNNYQYGVKGDFNPHNQYLHTMVILGIPGLLFLLAYLIIPLFPALKSRDYIYALFLLILLLNGMTESVLEVQKGVLFTAFFQTLFFMNLKQPDK